MPDIKIFTIFAAFGGLVILCNYFIIYFFMRNIPQEIRKQYIYFKFTNKKNIASISDDKIKEKVLLVRKIFFYSWIFEIIFFLTLFYLWYQVAKHDLGDNFPLWEFIKGTWPPKPPGFDY